VAFRGRSLAIMRSNTEKIMTDKNETLDQMRMRFRKKRETEFKRNKENIYMRLTGYDKYYYANQCWNFTQHILKHGFNSYKPSDIESLYFDTHNITIRLHSTAETDIKRFNNKQELLGYVVGFNDSQSQKVA
jgi:hypothetical protein